jgi:hypothetical protein
MFQIREMKIIRIALILIAISVMTCANKNVKDEQGKSTMPTKPVEKVLEEYTQELMSLPGVTGTAQGLFDEKPCIKVYVTEKTPELDKKIPGALEGYPVIIEETGEFEALPEN